MIKAVHLFTHLQVQLSSRKESTHSLSTGIKTCALRGVAALQHALASTADYLRDISGGIEDID